MLRQRLEFAGGRLELLACDEPSLEAATALAREHSEAGSLLARPVQLAKHAAWCKAEPLAASARKRHALRRILLRRPLPRFAEYANLEWLRGRCFDAPQPLAAGAWWRAGLPRWQFLVTEEIEAAPPLHEVLEQGGAESDATLEELAREVARLHSLHFIHRDLFARNFLVRETAAPRRLVFLDTWRGGARLQLRGVAYDLACLFLHLPMWLTPAEQRAWFELYVSERKVQGRPVDARKLAASVVRERRQLVLCYQRRGRSAELPELEAWSLGSP